MMLLLLLLLHIIVIGCFVGVGIIVRRCRRGAAAAPSSSIVVVGGVEGVENVPAGYLVRGGGVSCIGGVGIHLIIGLTDTVHSCDLISLDELFYDVEFVDCGLVGRGWDTFPVCEHGLNVIFSFFFVLFCSFIVYSKLFRTLHEHD